MEIHSSDKCEYCGHWAGDDEVPFVIYSKERAEWMEEAAEQLQKIDGGEDLRDWRDWIEEGKRLTKLGQ